MSKLVLVIGLIVVILVIILFAIWNKNNKKKKRFGGFFDASVPETCGERGLYPCPSDAMFTYYNDNPCYWTLNPYSPSGVMFPCTTNGFPDNKIYGAIPHNARLNVVTGQNSDYTNFAQSASVNPIFATTEPAPPKYTMYASQNNAIPGRCGVTSVTTPKTESALNGPSCSDNTQGFKPDGFTTFMILFPDLIPLGDALSFIYNNFDGPVSTDGSTSHAVVATTNHLAQAVNAGFNLCVNNESLIVPTPSGTHYFPVGGITWAVSPSMASSDYGYFIYAAALSADNCGLVGTPVTALSGQCGNPICANFDIQDRCNNGTIWACQTWYISPSTNQDLPTDFCANGDTSPGKHYWGNWGCNDGRQNTPTNNTNMYNAGTTSYFMNTGVYAANANGAMKLITDMCESQCTDISKLPIYVNPTSSPMKINAPNGPLIHAINVYGKIPDFSSTASLTSVGTMASDQWMTGEGIERAGNPTMMCHYATTSTPVNYCILGAFAGTAYGMTIKTYQGNSVGNNWTGLFS